MVTETHGITGSRFPRSSTRRPPRAMRFGHSPTVLIASEETIPLKKRGPHRQTQVRPAIPRTPRGNPTKGSTGPSRPGDVFEFPFQPSIVASICPARGHTRPAARRVQAWNRKLTELPWSPAEPRPSSKSTRLRRPAVPCRKQPTTRSRYSRMAMSRASSGRPDRATSSAIAR